MLKIKEDLDISEREWGRVIRKAERRVKMLPEFKCQNCDRHFFGWGIFLTCSLCGGELKPFNKTAKKREMKEIKSGD